jgi:hypothetical protein
MRTAIRLVLGTAMTAVGALALRDGWLPAGAAYVCLLFGSAVLVLVGWRWLERDRDRMLRWSDEHRLRAFCRVSPPETRPVSGPDAQLALDADALPEPVEEVGAGHSAAE